MTVVKINAIRVPEGMGPALEGRFAARAKAVDNTPGFQGFELLRPVAGDDRYFVVTHWESDEAFQAWVNSDAFGQGHAQESASAPDGGPGGGGRGVGGGDGAPQRPIGMGADLLEFEVVDLDGV